MYFAEIICGIALVFSLVGAGPLQQEHGNRPDNDDVFEDKVLFYLYTSDDIQNPTRLVLRKISRSSLEDAGFDKARKTLVVIHGYENDVNSPSVQDIKNAALESHDLNVIGVNWAYFTKNLDYGFSVLNSRKVGNYIAEFIESLIANGMSHKDLHIIGHSVGAHAAGFAGKRLQANGHPAARITGLDPALPGFYNLADAENRLNATDADYVDCIHTCGGILGIPTPICQADFFPNRGQNVQPGCTLFDFGKCSHGRAFQFFAESFKRTHLFNARTCKNYIFFVPSNCHDEGALMGYPAGVERYTGMFSLTTNSRYPFAKNVVAEN